jgi:acyl-CoA-binding protein
MNAEGEMTSSFQQSLDSAISGNTLFSVRSIASTFPADTDEARLCYAESYSVVRYLTDNYGSEKLLALLYAFKQGSTDDEALKQVYGFDTDGLNEAWRASLGLGPQPSATPVHASTSSDFTLTVPYIVMIALVFVLSAATVVLGFRLFRKWR